MTKLEEVLEEQGRKYSWLAKKLNVQARQVYRWARGEQAPKDRDKKEIARLLGMTVGWLFFDEGVPRKGHEKEE